MSDRVRRTWKAIPPSVKLGTIVLVGAALITEQVRGLSSWIVQTDELQHVRLALSAGEELDLTPGIHGAPVGGVSQLYPLLLAPVYQVFDMPMAFKVAHVLGAVVMSSAAIPAYLLTREVVSSRAAAYSVAALAIATPWSGFALVLGTEVLAYPMFLWAFLALQRAITAPSPATDLVAILAIGAAFLARAQLLVLAFAFPVAIVLHEIGYGIARRPRPPASSAVREGLSRALSGHVVVAGALALGALLAAGGMLGELLGPYRGTVGQSALFPDGWLETALKHVSIVGVASGLLPIVLTVAWLPLVLVAPRNKAVHAFAILACVAGILLCLQASSFVVQFSGPLAADRYFFYIVPLLLVGAAAFVVEGPRRWSAALFAAVAFAVVVPQAPFDLTTREAMAYQASPASAVNPQLADAAEQLGEILPWGTPSPADLLFVAALALGLCAAAVLRFLPSRRLVWLLVVALLLSGVLQGRHASSALRGQQFVGLPGRDWIDRVSPSGPVGLVPSPIDSAFAATEGRELWWDAEFWNRSVKHAYSYAGATTYTPFPARPLQVNPMTGRLGGGRVTAFLVIARDRVDLGLQGRIVATNGFLELIDLGEIPTARWTARGLKEGGALPPSGTAAVSVYPPRTATRPRRMKVAIRMAAADDARAPRGFRIAVDGAVVKAEVRPGHTAERRLSLCIDTRPSTLRISLARPVAAPRPDSRSPRLAAIRVSSLRGECGR